MCSMETSRYLEKSKVYKNYHYSAIAEEQLEYLHRRTLEMFDQVKVIFDQNKIDYMVCGGTLLGAISGGKGFIPWDDDFDLCVFEEDYDRAVQCLTDEVCGLKDGAVLQCKETDANYYLGWMKVRDQNSHVYPDAPAFRENGVWIDLYKIVKTREVDVPVLVAKEAMDYLDRRLAAQGITQEEYQNRFSQGKLRENYENALELRRDNNEGARERTVYVIWSASKVMLEEEWLRPIREVQFEGRMVTTFHRAEEYLIRHYGEGYQQYPPEELRRIGICRIDK